MEKESPDFDVEHGMDSSRGGPLTTFIMMLPLIVVPAIAMLKPADLKEGWLGEMLSASENSDTKSAGSDAAGFVEVADDFDDLDLFSDDPPSADPSDSLDDSLFGEASGNALINDFAHNSPRTAPSAPPQAGLSSQDPAIDAATQDLLAQVRQMGATRTLWFSPNPQSFGFVAFFKPTQGLVSYRFEATDRSRAEAVQSVLQQVRTWQREQQ